MGKMQGKELVEGKRWLHEKVDRRRGMGEGSDDALQRGHEPLESEKTANGEKP